MKTVGSNSYRQAFSQISHIDHLTGVKRIYHFSETGHGKGPYDGEGADIKHGLNRLVIQDKVRLRIAYEAYLASAKYLGDVGRNAEGKQKANTVLKKLNFMIKRKCLKVPVQLQ